MEPSLKSKKLAGEVGGITGILWAFSKMEPDLYSFLFAAGCITAIALFQINWQGYLDKKKGE